MNPKKELLWGPMGDVLDGFGSEVRERLNHVPATQAHGPHASSWAKFGDPAPTTEASNCIPEVLIQNC